jgi:hypothetical protein
MYYDNATLYIIYAPLRGCALAPPNARLSAKGKIPMKLSGDSKTDLMKQYGIAFKGYKYCYAEFKYDRLEDAIAYAKLNPLSQQPDAKGTVDNVRITFTVLGGSGWPLMQGDECVLRRSDADLELVPSAGDILKIPRSQLICIEITGPGTVTSNANIVGGGFGLEGAAIGMLLAGAINAATTRKRTDTVLRLVTRSAEIFLHTSAIELALLRLKLSPEFVHVEALKLPGSFSVVSELNGLDDLRARGVLTADEFHVLKARMVSAYQSAN